jgi:hypothetical protein
MSPRSLLPASPLALPLFHDLTISKLLDSCGWVNPRQLGPTPTGQENEDIQMPSLASMGLGVGGKMDGIILMIRKNIQLEAQVAQLQRDMSGEAEATLKEKQHAQEIFISLENCRKVPHPVPPFPPSSS